MFVSKESAGMGERISSIPKQEKSGKQLLGELQNIKIVSHTGLAERRNLVRSWSTEELIRAHTAVRTRIALAGLISYVDRILLEAMEIEGIKEGGHHTNKIQTSEEYTIIHGQGLTTTNNNGDTVAGFTKIAVWKIIS